MKINELRFSGAYLKEIQHYLYDQDLANAIIEIEESIEGNMTWQEIKLLSVLFSVLLVISVIFLNLKIPCTFNHKGDQKSMKT